MADEPRRLRTQAERNADGTTLRQVPDDLAPAFLVTITSPVTLDQLAELKGRLTRPGRPMYLTAELKISRRRWWHRYTRRNP